MAAAAPRWYLPNGDSLEASVKRCRVVLFNASPMTLLGASRSSMVIHRTLMVILMPSMSYSQPKA